MKKRILSLVLVCCMVLGTLSTALAADEGNAARISLGTNGDAMVDIMEKYPTNMVGKYDDWQQYLYGQWQTQAMDKFQWADTSGKNLTPYGGSASNVTFTDADTAKTTPKMIPQYENNTYHVYFGEQLYYALGKLKQGDTILIHRDLDLNGAEENWDGNSFKFTGVTIRGAKEDSDDDELRWIYNLGCKETVFINQLIKSTVKNLHFESAMVVFERGAQYVGVFSNIGKAQDDWSNPTLDTLASALERVEVANSLFYNGNPDAATMGKQYYLSPLGHTTHLRANDCYSAGNYLFGGPSIHVGGMFARAEDIDITSCYSVDSVVVAAGEHSGGFISCSDVTSAYPIPQNYTGLRVENCFTNNKVYGSASTGVFIGAVNLWAPAAFKNCYASGTIEGTSQLGGFIGQIDDKKGRSLTFENCYSTSIVGMTNGGNNLGGFVGEVKKTDSQITFTNCYAAGEVGSSDTDVSPNRLQNKDVGGFLGVATGGSPTFANCYYDKQATAMHEWETGTTRDAASNLLGGDGALGENDIAGIRGVLTSNSNKSGAGLAAMPANGQTAGFAGFGTTTFVQDMPMDDTWVFDGGGDPEGKHNCGYPQLNVFFDAKESDWQNHVDKVRAYSYASAAAAHLNVWDKCVNPEHDSLITTSYDTVRDVTSRFTLTSYVNPGSGTDILTPNQITWAKETEATAPELYGKNGIPVIGYLGHNFNEMYSRDYWTTDQFAPGVQWFTVQIQVGDAVGSRRMRILPNLNLSPGSDNLDLKAGETYNHAADVYLANSTGARLAADVSDITQGVFPDKPSLIGSDSRKDILKKLMVLSGSVYEPTGTGVPDTFLETGNGYRNLSATYMTGAVGALQNGHPHDYINANLYRASVKQVGSKYQIVKDEEVALQTDANDPSSLTDWGKKLSGQAAFTESDSGRYLLEYTWVMPDARFVRASKMLVIQPAEHTVDVQVVDGSGAPRADVLELSIAGYGRAAVVPQPTFSGTTESRDSAQISKGNYGMIAVQKQDPTDVITKIEVEIASLEGKQNRTFEKLEVGSTISFPFTYYSTPKQEGLDYFVEAKTVTKTYALQYDADKNYFYLLLNQDVDLDPWQGIDRNDITDNYTVKLTVATPGKFWITDTAQGGGSIAKPQMVIDEIWLDADGKTVWAKAGQTPTYTFTPNAGNTVKAVFVDNVPLDAADYTNADGTFSYTFPALDANHNLVVQFEEAGKHNIVAIAKAGGSVSLDSGTTKESQVQTTVADNGGQEITITPESGYRLLEILVNGEPVVLTPNDVGNAKPYTYNFTNVTEDQLLVASFTREYDQSGYFTLTSGYDGPGKVTPLGQQIVSKGGTRVYLIQPNSNAKTDRVEVDDIAQSNTITSYTFLNVQKDGEIFVQFKDENTPPTPTNYIITASAGANGSITPNGATSVASGANQSFTFTPASGYVVDTVTVDGVAVANPGASYTFTGVTANHTIHVTFKEKPSSGGGGGSDTPRFSLDYEAETGGKVTGDKHQTVSKGQDGKPVVAVPEDGYIFIGWSDGVKTSERQDLKVNKNIKVTAQFKPVEDWSDALNRDDHVAYIIGYPNGTVRPEQSITRGEVATIFFRLLRDEVRTENWSTSNSFTDVAGSAWYNNAVSTMANMGALQGDPSGTFRPEGAITRAEFATIAARFADPKEQVKPQAFTDTRGHWAEAAIGRAATLGWVQGYADGAFHPDAQITRAEAVTLVNRVLERQHLTADSLLADMVRFPDCREMDWFYLAMQEATNSHEYTRAEDRMESWTHLRPNEDWKRFESEWAAKHAV